MRIVHVDGQYLPEDEARISVFDRGFLFGDAVYEVAAVLEGRLIDNEAHLDRLERSLSLLDIPWPCPRAELIERQQELVTRNELQEGLLYLQVSRGAADREFHWEEGMTPTLVMFTQANALLDNKAVREGIRIATLPDLRWQRRDIKTVNLLPAAWTKQQARAQGFDDAWMVEDGVVTEGTSNNAFIISEDGVLITRQLGNEILHGITRAVVMKLAQEIQLRIEERPFTPEEAKRAREAFVTSATGFVKPVVAIDEAQIADGTPGPISQRLRELYIAEALAR
ncbi:MAG: D-amino-acid transaminase [Neomegalonema sp.]|nr:D-amino-acid transaminase [Neomegalonema sp.]